LLALLDAPQSTGVNLPGALRAFSTEGFLHLVRMEGGKALRPVPPLPPQPLLMGQEALTFGAVTLTMLPHVPDGACPDGKRTVALPRSLAQDAVVRNPKPGDRIRPFGAAGAKPLRRYLTDQKLDLPFRSTLPVVAAGRDILWAVGVGAAECTRAGDEPSVWLSLQGDLPWFNF
jgi:tRNA(Ile)-lysidine synthetase-like protein